MKKVIYALLLVLVFTSIIMISTEVRAEAGKITIEKVEVTSPETGSYETGTEVTIVATFSEELKNEDSVPILNIAIGRNTKGLYDGTISGKTITYKYTISDLEGGVIEFKSIVGTVKNKSGEATVFTNENNGNITLSGKKITVNPLKWTDTSKLKFSFDDEFALVTEGLTQLNGHSYFLYVTNTKTAPKIETEESGMPKGYYSYLTEKVYLKDVLEKNGDIYVWICETQSDLEKGMV